MAQRIHLLNVLLFVGVILVACNLLWGDSPVTENLSPEVGEENETRPNLSQLVAKDEVPVVKKKMSSETKSFPSKEKQVRPHILGSGEHSPDSFNSRVDWDAILCPSQGSEMDSCDLKDPKWGVPVILMSHGRSGSGVTWDTLASLATSANPNPDAIWQPAQERTGGSAKSNLAQLNEHPDEHGKCWLETIMCRQQFQNRENFDDGKQSLVYGTKWKPERHVLEHPRAKQALEWLAATPEIKIVFNERNPLDVSISKIKHDYLDGLPNHCRDIECQEQAALYWGNFSVPIEQLEKSLKKSKNIANVIGKVMQNVTYLPVSYEDLYYSDHMVEEWQRVMRFVGRDDVAQNLTLDFIKSKITHIATHPPDRSENIANYDEVKKSLTGTEFEKLLYYP